MHVFNSMILQSSNNISKAKGESIFVSRQLFTIQEENLDRSNLGKSITFSEVIEEPHI